MQRKRWWSGAKERVTLRRARVASSTVFGCPFDFFPRNFISESSHHIDLVRPIYRHALNIGDRGSNMMPRLRFLVLRPEFRVLGSSFGMKGSFLKDVYSGHKIDLYATDLNQDDHPRAHLALIYSHGGTRAMLRMHIFPLSQFWPSRRKKIQQRLVSARRQGGGKRYRVR